MSIAHEIRRDEEGARSPGRSGPPRLLGIIGHSGAGKTTLLEKLVPLLRARGLSVGVLKHDAHRIELDREGKDSFRLREAGADAVVLASDRMVFLSAPPPESPGPEELIRRHLSGLDLDVVLLEGYTKHPHPKVEVIHPLRPPRAGLRGNQVVAWVHRGSAPPEGPRPFPADRPVELLDYLVEAGHLPDGR